MALTNVSNEERLQREQELIERWIVPHRGKRGHAESVILNNGTSVWVIIYQWLYDGNIERVKSSYELSEEAFDAAIAYYRQHKHVIDARITLEDDMLNDPR